MHTQTYGVVTPEELSRVIPAGTRRNPDVWLRDAQITVGRDAYYLTGTTRPDNTPPVSATMVSDGLRVWRSENLRDWEALGLVWSIDEGPAWMRDYRVHGFGGRQTMTPEEFAAARVPDNHPVRRALWAPKIHYSKSRDNYYVATCLNFNMGIDPANWVGDVFGGTFLLESTTGKPTGPYRPTTAGPLTHYIDPCLFEDDDGSLWIIWQDGNVGRFNDRLDGLVEVNRPWQKHYDVEPTREGAVLFKHGGRYHLGFSISAHSGPDGFSYRHKGHGRRDIACGYNFVVASAPTIHGPYGPRYTSLVNGGHGCPFQDREGRWWACAFHPVGTPHEHHQDYAKMVRDLGPRLVPMKWEGDFFVPDATRAPL